MKKSPSLKPHNPEQCPFCVKKPFYSLQDLAELLDIDLSTVRSMIKKKTFPIYTFLKRDTPTGVRRVASYAAVRRYMNHWSEETQVKLEDDLIKKLILRKASRYVDRLMKRKVKEVDYEAQLEEDNAEAIKRALQNQMNVDAQELISKRTGGRSH